MNLRTLPLSLLLFFVVSVGCKQNEDAMPTTAEGRIEQFAAKTPAKAESLFLIPDVSEFRSSLSLFKDRVAETGVVDGFQKSLETAIGVDVLNEESWKAAGLAPKSSVGMTVFKSRPVVFLYVDNRQAFEKVMIERAKRTFQIEAVTKQETVGKHKVKVLSDDPAKQIAWLYKGKLAIVAMPATSGEGALEDGTAALIATNILDNNKEESFASAPQFAKFKKNVLPNGVVSTYINSKSYLDNPEIRKQITDQPRSEIVLSFLKKNIEYIGAHADFKGDRLTIKAHIGGTESFNAVAKEIAKVEADGKWGSFVTDKLGLGIRVSLEPQKAYNFALASMSEEERRAFKRNLKRSTQGVGLDVENDIINGLSGQIGLFFYGIAGNNPMAALQAVQDPMQMASKLGLLLVLRFKNKAALDNVISKLVASETMPAKVGVLDVGEEELADFKTLTFPLPQQPVRIVAHDDTLLISTTAFGDAAIHGYLTGSRSNDKALGGVEGMDLGKEFATSKEYVGLYANAERLSANPGQLLAMLGAGAIIDVAQEAKLTLGAEDHGVFVQVVADLDAKAPAAEAGK